MFERQRYLRSVFCVISLWMTTTAVAQSNQPIDIESTKAATQRSDLHETPGSTLDAPAADEVLAEPRLTRIAKKLTSAPPQRPMGAGPPGSSSVRERPESEAQSVIAGPKDGATVTVAGANEHRRLGRPSGVSATGGEDSTLRATAISPGWLLHTVTALGVVIGCIFLIRSVLTRLGRTATVGAHSPLLEVMARISVAPRKHILLVRMGQRIMVVGDGAGGLCTLANIDDAEEVASLLASVAATRGGGSGGFTGLLSRFNRDYGDDVRRIDEGGDVSEHHIDRARDKVSGLLARVRHLNLSRRGGVV